MNYYNEGDVIRKHEASRLEPDIQEDVEADHETPWYHEDRYGTVTYYKTRWDMVMDNHFQECPMYIAAKKQMISTFCACDLVAEAQCDPDNVREGDNY